MTLRIRHSVMLSAASLLALLAGGAARRARRTRRRPSRRRRLKNADAGAVRRRSHSIRAGGGSSRIRFSTQLDDARARRPITTCASPWRASTRRARSSTMCRLDRYPTVTAGASVDRREQADARLHRRAVARSPPIALGFDAFWEIDLFGRVRIRGARGGRQRARASRRRSTTCGSAWRRRSRATTSSCAACSSSWRWPSAAWRTSGRRCG